MTNRSGTFQTQTANMISVFCVCSFVCLLMKCSCGVQIYIIHIAHAHTEKYFTRKKTIVHCSKNHVYYSHNIQNQRIPVFFLMKQINYHLVVSALSFFSCVQSIRQLIQFNFTACPLYYTYSFGFIHSFIHFFWR